ncbi:MAG: trigger factor [Eubacteriales bacterium]
MKKRMIATLVAVMTIATLVGCSSTTEETTEEVATEEAAEEAVVVEEVAAMYLSDLDVDQYVTLGDYTGLSAELLLPNITDEDVAYLIDQLLAGSATQEVITDRPVETGDTVNIDYVGMKDGVAFDGGTAAGYDLVIGSGSFIDGFEDGLIGVESGEVVDLDLTFPEAYSSEELAGAEVVFTVTVNSITATVVPELTDDFVATLTAMYGLSDCTTVETLQTYVHDALYVDEASTQVYYTQYDLLETIVANATFSSLPEDFLAYYKNQMMDAYTAAAEQYGFDLETYMLYFEGTDDYEATFDAYAEDYVKQALVCKKIADLEGIEVTDDTLNAYLESVASSYGYSTVEEYQATVDMQEFSDSVLVECVMSFIYENSIITEVEEAIEDVETEEVVEDVEESSEDAEAESEE